MVMSSNSRKEEILRNQGFLNFFFLLNSEIEMMSCMAHSSHSSEITHAFFHSTFSIAALGLCIQNPKHDQIKKNNQGRP